jgi:ribose transport system permease protein
VESSTKVGGAIGVLAPGGFDLTRLRRRVYRWTGPLWVWVVLFVLLVGATATVPDFGTWENFTNILRQAVPLAIVAIGQTAVILTAGIDLSVVAVVAMGNTLAMGIMDGSDGRIWLAVLAPLALGIIAGGVSGTVIARTAAPPFIVTLGAASIIQGIVFWYTDSATYGTPGPSFGQLGFEDWGPLPALVVLFIPLLILGLVVQNRTRAGRHLYAVGDDDRVAERAGVPVTRVKIGVYAFSGALAALAGVAVATRTGAGEPLSGTGFDWDSIAAAVIGGAALTGGRGGIGGTMIGVLIIATIDNAMTLQNVSSFWQSTVKGIIVLVAVIIAAVSAKDLIRRYLHAAGERWRRPAAGPGPPSEEGRST